MLGNIKGHQKKKNKEAKEYSDALAGEEREGLDELDEMEDMGDELALEDDILMADAPMDTDFGNESDEEYEKTLAGIPMEVLVSYVKRMQGEEIMDPASEDDSY